MIVYFDFIDSDRKKKLGRWIGQAQNITSNKPVGKFVQMAFPYGRTPYLCDLLASTNKLSILFLLSNLNRLFPLDLGYARKIFGVFVLL